MRLRYIAQDYTAEIIRFVSGPDNGDGVGPEQSIEIRCAQEMLLFARSVSRNKPEYLSKIKTTAQLDTFFPKRKILIANLEKGLPTPYIVCYG